MTIWWVANLTDWATQDFDGNGQVGVGTAVWRCATEIGWASVADEIQLLKIGRCSSANKAQYKNNLRVLKKKLKCYRISIFVVDIIYQNFIQTLKIM